MGSLTFRRQESLTQQIQAGHKKDEVARLHTDHPEGPKLLKDGRALGLAVTRAFGNSSRVESKRKHSVDYSVRPSHFARSNERTETSLLWHQTVCGTMPQTNMLSTESMAQDYQGDCHSRSSPGTQFYLCARNLESTKPESKYGNYGSSSRRSQAIYTGRRQCGHPSNSRCIRRKQRVFDL